MDQLTTLSHDIQAIIKYVYENPGVHRNVLRKKLLQTKKISSQKRFQDAFTLLVSNGRLVQNRENVTLAESEILPAVLKNRDGKYFAVLPKSNKRFFVSNSVASGYVVGDLVFIALDNTTGKETATILGRCDRETYLKAEGKPQPTQTPTDQVLGRVVKLSHDNLVFIPNKKSIPTRQIPILNPVEEHSRFQDKICVMNLADPSAPLLGGVITAVKGDAGNPIHEYDAIAESYGAIMSWEGDKIEAEITAIPATVETENLPLITEAQAKAMQRGHVVDLRHIPFSTVDPATCKDMDDAIFSYIDQNGDLVCYTAVANVTKYVNLFSEIGKRYLAGAFTIYAPNKAYNILPSQLSTGVCSLNPDENRLALVVKTTLDSKTGKVKSSTIYDALIKSRHKYSYEEAQEIVDRLEPHVTLEDLERELQTSGSLSEDHQVLMNYHAGRIIKLGFERRRMIRFIANKEREVVFNGDLSDVADIISIPHLYFHEVIEAFMITANEATAKYTRDKNLPNVYRVHDKPKESKVERANEFFNILGVEFDGDLSASGTRALIEQIRRSPVEETVNNFLIKMQSRAMYSSSLYGEHSNDESTDWMGERISHYALQSLHYSHSTSPIRRAPDYVTHYNILADMHGTPVLSEKFIQKLVDVANRRQLEVDQAEKDFEDVSSAIYCEKHIGEEMTGIVSKLRYTSPAEGYADDIVVIVKNQEKGINVEIPLSQILGHPADDCELSRERCAVYNKKGEIVLSLCKPIKFIIEKADRKSMIVVGSTSKTMVKDSNFSLVTNAQTDPHRRAKNKRQRRINNNHSHKTPEIEEDEFQ